jgi:hypothetical protein
VVNSQSVRSAVLISPDESFEVTKGALWAHGNKLYKEVWNNQPPLHTAILGTLFKVFGPSISVARGLAIWFGVMLITGCFLLVQARWGTISAYSASIALVVAPQVLRLSVATMLELPAIALAIWAFLPLQQWRKRQHPGFLVLSALIFASALEIKLTAVIAGPALAIEVLLGTLGSESKEKARNSFVNLGVWITSIVGWFSVLSFWLGGSYQQMWGSLFSSRMANFLSNHNELAFSLTILLQHPEGLLGAGIGLLLLILTNDWRRGILPVALLSTVACVHFWRRPYWPYYYLHFAVPFALLTGVAIGKLFLISSTIHCNVKILTKIVRPLVCLAAVALSLFVFVHGSRRFLNEIERISSLPLIKDSLIINKMKQYQPKTNWAYGKDSIVMFHAHVLLVPELAILPDNRYWSGNISPDQIFDVLKQRKPEQLLISEDLGSDLQSFIDDNYTKVFEDARHQLYVLNALVY